MCELTRSMNFIKSKCEETIEAKAEKYRELQLLKKEITKQEKIYKNELIKEEKTFFFPDTEEKIAYIEGKPQSQINSKGVYLDLCEEGRQNEFFDIVKISEKDLKDIKNGGVMVAKHKSFIGVTAPSLSLKKMSKKDILEHVES